MCNFFAYNGNKENSSHHTLKIVALAKKHFLSVYKYKYWINKSWINRTVSRPAANCSVI